MLTRLFGASNEEQFQFLKSRMIITVALAVISAIGYLITKNSSFSILIAIAFYIWGWQALKSMFGVTTIGAIFSGNFIAGVMIFILYLLVGYVAGMVIFIIGLCRFIQLFMSHKGNIN